MELVNSEEKKEVYKPKPIIEEIIYIGIYDPSLTQLYPKLLSESKTKTLKFIWNLELAPIKLPDGEYNFTVFTSENSQGAVLFECYKLEYAALKQILQNPIEYSEFLKLFENKNQSVDIHNNDKPDKFCLLNVGLSDYVPILTLKHKNEQLNGDVERKKEEFSPEDLAIIEKKIDSLFNHISTSYTRELAQSYLYDQISNMRKYSNIPADQLIKKLFSGENAPLDLDTDFGLDPKSIDRFDFEYDFGFHIGDKVFKVPTMSQDTGNFDWNQLKFI